MDKFKASSARIVYAEDSIEKEIEFQFDGAGKLRSETLLSKGKKIFRFLVFDEKTLGWKEYSKKDVEITEQTPDKFTISAYKW
jgi:hypothetical protein